MPVTDKLQQNWTLALEQLENQMTSATFGWLRESRVVDVDAAADALVVSVQGEAARQWLENRLYQTVQRAVMNVYGYPWSIKFVSNGHGRGSVPAAIEPPPDIPKQQTKSLESSRSIVYQPAAALINDTDIGQLLAGADYWKVFYASGGLGYAMLSHYAAYFWQPYLGDAFDLWKRLDAEEQSSIKILANRWSAPGRYYYKKLARMVGKSHPRSIKGGEVECWRTRMARMNGDPVHTCCGNPDFQPVRVEAGRDGYARCMHWQTGLLEILYLEHLVAIKEAAAQKWSNKLEIQVWRVLPVLTPHQVNKLNVDLQDEHARWIGDNEPGPLGKILGINLAGWESIEAESLVPLLPGYAEHRQLKGQFNPKSRILGQCCSKIADEKFF